MGDRTPADILVVDDEDAIRLTLDVLLKRRGYAVTTAATGEEAVALLAQRRFDLLLVDLKLPGIDGLTVARRAEQSQPDLQIVFLTGSSDFHGNPVEEQVGHFAYILKTASPAEVLAYVERLLPGETAAQ